MNKYHKIGDPWTCVCCLHEQKGIPTSDLCMWCLIIMCYDGWDRREKDLTIEEVRKLHPERINKWQKVVKAKILNSINRSLDNLKKKIKHYENN